MQVLEIISISSSFDLISFVELLSINHAGEKGSLDKFLKKDGELILFRLDCVG